MDAKDCEQYSDHVCCDCNNQHGHQLEEKYKAMLNKINALVYHVQVGNIPQSKAFAEIHRIIEGE